MRMSMVGVMSSTAETTAAPPTVSASAYVTPPWTTCVRGLEEWRSSSSMRPSAWPSTACVISMPTSRLNGMCSNIDSTSIPAGREAPA